MSLATLFSFRSVSASQDEIPVIFPALVITQNDFVDIDIVQIYSKILTDVVERVRGLTDEQTQLLWDNCLMGNANDGLITLLADAMANKSELFLIYDASLELVREADATEKSKIKADYETTAESSLGIYISFKGYTKSDMVRLYSGLEYCTVDALSKSMNLSKAIQIKISDLRGSISNSDSAESKAQALAIATGLSNGKDVMLDAKDFIETSRPDLESVNSSLALLDKKRSFYLGLPAAYVTGEQSSGMNASGEMDTRAVERGLKSYWYSIVKPVFEQLFDTKLTYKSQDFRQLNSALEAMKTFDLTSEEFLSNDNKKAVIEGLLEIDPTSNKTVEADAIVETKPANGGPSGGLIPNAKEVTA